MRSEKEILAEAVSSLYMFTKIEATIEGRRLQYYSYLNIAGERFVVEVKSEITKGNKGIVLAHLKKISFESKLPVLLVAKYIPSYIVKEYTEEGINCLDVAGNCYIRHKKLFLVVDGKKVKAIARVNQPRAFQEAGIKLLFQFLVDPGKTRLPYRNLAQLANISLGSVSMIIRELTDLSFILKTKQSIKLKNTAELLNRWITAYHDVLRPRLLKKQMRFISQEKYIHWKEIDFKKIDGIAFWGGEPAANLLTGYLHPGSFTIYTDQNWQSFKEIELVPDETGKVEILEMFWSQETYSGVPPVLVYADLMSSGSDRNIETAKMIFNNELQNIR